MRILHVEGGRNFYGGAHQVLLLMEGLAARGVENVLVCPRGSELAQRAEGLATVWAMPMRGDLDLSLIFRLRAAIRATRPDVLHLQSRIGADVMGGLAGRLEGLPIVHTRRQDNPESPWMVALKYRLHDRIIAISKAIGEVLLSEGLPAKKLRCITDAVDITPPPEPEAGLLLRQRFGIEPGAPVIGVVGQLIARKGHSVLLEALPTILLKHPALKVLFFGKGPLQQALEADLHRRRLQTVVTLAGFREDLGVLLPGLDLLVHPALREGMGVTLLQAGLAQVPVVASATGGIPEVVRTEETGLLVAPGEPAPLAAAVIELLDQPLKRAAYGQNGRRWVAERFSAQNMVDSTLAVYRELLEPDQSSP